jgi:hypothetical protein
LELLGETTKLNGTDMKLLAAHANLAERGDLPWINTFDPSSKSTSILVPSFRAIATP